MRILLLEDELMLQSAIVEYLTNIGYEVEAFEDGEDAFEAACSKRHDLFIFDINTPTIKGLDLLEKLQNCKIHVPAIFISAITEIEQISKAYELGCYGYLKKPFHLKELELQIHRWTKAGDIDAKHLVRISAMYTFDIDSNRLLFDGEEQKLSQKQIDIISLLARNSGKIIDFDRLRYEIWDRIDIDNPTIRAEVHRLRGVLKEDIIETIKGVGYRLRAL
ncbi:MAG: response regulator transcription factor [Campylobacterales bacterium]|nr:response regulator transcription factor [Campylobacterales bacterium]